MVVSVYDVPLMRRQVVASLGCLFKDEDQGLGLRTKSGIVLVRSHGQSVHHAPHEHTKKLSTRPAAATESRYATSDTPVRYCYTVVKPLLPRPGHPQATHLHLLPRWHNPAADLQKRHDSCRVQCLLNPCSLAYSLVHCARDSSQEVA